MPKKTIGASAMTDGVRRMSAHDEAALSGVGAVVAHPKASRSGSRRGQGVLALLWGAWQMAL